MPQTQDQLKRIHDKLQQVLQQHQLLLKENAKLKQEIEEERNHNLERLHQLEQLQQQISILKSNKEDMNGEEKKNFEKRLSQYIKEIDKCITLLKE